MSYSPPRKPLKDPLSADELEKEEFVHTKQVSNYLIGPRIGKGAFATVNIGLHCLTTEKVAIKVINKLLCDKDNYIKKHLRREGKILQQLRHRNIVQLLEIMETENSYYLILELCHCNLMTKILKSTRLTEAQTKGYMRQIILAIDYLHQLCIMHRDLKVENILLTKEDVIKVADFGVSIQFPAPNQSHTVNAKRDDNNIIYQKHICKTQCGSPAYAAPEVLSKSLYDYSADIWSIGINMFAMLTGKLPFTVKPFNLQALKDKMISGDINKMPDNLSRESKNLMMQFLTPEPQKRITLRQAMQNSWFNTESQLSTWNHGTNSCDINLSLVRYMDEKLGFRKSDTIKSVLGNLPNSPHASYHLLMSKAVRHCSVDRIPISKWLSSVCSQVNSTVPDNNCMQKLNPFNEITNSKTSERGLDILTKRNSKICEETDFKPIDPQDYTREPSKVAAVTPNMVVKRQLATLSSAKSTVDLTVKSNKSPNTTSRLLPHINEINIPYFTQINAANSHKSLLFPASRAHTTMQSFNHRKLSVTEGITHLSKSKLQSGLAKKTEDKLQFDPEFNRSRRFSVGSGLKNNFTIYNR